MKIKLDERKGITLVSLAITIAVMLILASVATYSGVNILRQAKLNKFTAEMKLMQTEVNDLYNRYKNGEDVLNLGKDLTGQEEQVNKVFTNEASEITETTGYRYFDKETLDNLGIDGVDGEFFVNIEKRSVVSYEGLKYEGVTYYTLAQLPDGLYNVDYQDRNTEKPTFDVATTVNNDKYTITVSNIQYNGYIEKWQVKYQKEGQTDWLTSEDLSFQLESGGKYNIMLVNGEVESDPVTVSLIAFDGTWNDDKGINMPVIKDNMELVKYDADLKAWVTDEDGSSINYVAGTGTDDNTKSQWANAIVTIDGVESYFVWIPRFEYSINNAEHTIDVKFIPTSKTEADDGYIIHPAFTTNVDNGGWTSELPGIWVGKYETARSDSQGAEQGSNTTLKVQPGVTSMRDVTIGDMYTYARAYSDNLNSHMLKNSEWGAVAYLTHSQYGRYGVEVTINDNTEGNYLTAEGDIEVNASQSSTGNVYGIYDLSGGANEYVAAYYSESTSDSLTNNGGSFASKGRMSTEYVTAYGDTLKPGDATSETNGWNGNEEFIDSDNPFFTRGGDFNTETDAGIFNLVKSIGNAEATNGFRICLVVL